MKTTFKAKIIIVSDTFVKSGSESTYPIQVPEIHKLIETGKFTVEIIDNYLESSYEPVIIFKER